MIKIVLLITSALMFSSLDAAQGDPKQKRDVFDVKALKVVAEKLEKPSIEQPKDVRVKKITLTQQGLFEKGLGDDLKNLRDLSLSNCTITTDVLEGLPLENLLRFDLDKCSYVTDIDFKSIVSRLVQVRCFSASYNSVTDRELFHFAQYLRELEALTIYYCKGVTDVGFSYLVGKFPKLKVLDLGGNQAITDNSLLFLQSSFPELKTLKLNACSQITDRGVGILALQFPQLRLLNLSGCSKITDCGLKVLVLQLLQLRTLCLKGCHGLNHRFQKSFNYTEIMQLRKEFKEQEALEVIAWEDQFDSKLLSEFQEWSFV